MRSPLQPEQRTDRNGRTQRRWVRPTHGAPGAAAIPPPTPASHAGSPLERLVTEAFGSDGRDVLLWLERLDAPLAGAYEDIARTAADCDDGASIVRDVLDFGGLPERSLFAVRECADLLPDIERVLGPDGTGRPYHAAIRAVEERTTALYSNYTLRPSAERVREDALMLRAAVLAGLMGLAEDLSSPFEEHAQYAAVAANFDTLRTRLPELASMAATLRGAGIKGDAGIYAHICAAAGDRDNVFSAIAEMAVARGRLDRDDALAVARGGTPAIASGML